jgi:hypothetical protein
MQYTKNNPLLWDYFIKFSHIFVSPDVYDLIKDGPPLDWDRKDGDNTIKVWDNKARADKYNEATKTKPKDGVYRKASFYLKSYLNEKDIPMENVCRVVHASNITELEGWRDDMPSLGKVLIS